MSAPGRPKRESSLGEAVAQRPEGRPFDAPGRPKRESSLGEGVAQRPEGRPFDAPGRPKRESSLGEGVAQRPEGRAFDASGRPKRESSLGEAVAQRPEDDPVNSGVVGRAAGERRRLLVTGASGFVGQALRRRWPGSPWERDYEWVEPGLPLDLRVPEQVDSLVAAARPDAVLHLAAQSFVPASFADPAGTLAVNLNGTLHLLQALARHRFAGRLLYVSSADIYGAAGADELPLAEARAPAPRNPYAVSKAAAEMLCRQWHFSEGLDVVVARPFNHVGVGQAPRFVLSGFARQIARIRLGLEPPRLITGSLDVSRDFSSVDSVLEAYAALFHKGVPGQTYNVCSGREQYLGDLLGRMLELAQVEAAQTLDPALVRPSEQRRVCGDASRLRQDTGWQPEPSLDPTIQAMLDWWYNTERSSS
ncbi:MAG: GDP-mannose 4,6-dehydratase [Pigmentiphaga sp.]|nr:GDP-mannose 4,6-dehydratase [Pigmentiphaga sp.]